VHAFFVFFFSRALRVSQVHNLAVNIAFYGLVVDLPPLLLIHLSPEELVLTEFSPLSRYSADLGKSVDIGEAENMK
jgi:hypothetical protein